MTPDELITKHRGKSVFVDTNLLILLVVGLYRRSRISSFPRTRSYTPEDFDLLVRLVSLFQKRIATPHVFAEADNLTRQLPETEHGAIADVMARMIADSFEIYKPSSDASLHPRYSLLGLTDCTIIAASTETLVITDDLRLANILTKLGRDAININHLRMLGWT